ncbi:hypothetical protein JZ751_029760 [Albula glossodonta]|uniref:Uncharacterized protein n=1 Tax=Albula glossodonta TaxID=121402 RepID=A0A8T2NHE2_9TELE|nr:hypothetical protein JZ751_029760 [Albula glossodonta]
MGLGSRLLSPEQQHFKEFPPEIVPERAASSLLLSPAAFTFRLEVAPRRLLRESANEIISPLLWKNCDRHLISPSALHLTRAPFSRGSERRISNALRWLHEDTMNHTEPGHDDTLTLGQ